LGKRGIACLVLTFPVASFVVASRVNEVLAGQVIAASASISVAAVGFWFYFKKPKD
jgi:hypothetical protein